MKVILLKDVAGVGVRGTVKDVSDGYAFNYLLPQRLAEAATPAKIAEAEAKKTAEAVNTSKREMEWMKSAEMLNGQVVVVHARANQLGNLYTQLPLELIGQAVKEQLGVELPPNCFAINAPIKSVGETSVEVRLGKYPARFNVNVIQSGEGSTHGKIATNPNAAREERESEGSSGVTKTDV